MQSGGIGINLVTKRGTNQFHGGARYFLADGDWSSSNLPDDLVDDPRLRGADAADRVNNIKDWGFDLGGPIVKDKLWFYGTFGRQDIKSFRLTQTKDDTVLDSRNVKVNWQATSQTMVSGFYFLGAKKKFGRAVGYVGESGRFPLGPGQCLHGRRTAGRPVEAAGRPHDRVQLLHFRESRILRHRLRSVPWRWR